MFIDTIWNKKIFKVKNTFFQMYQMSLSIIFKSYLHPFFQIELN